MAAHLARIQGYLKTANTVSCYPRLSSMLAERGLRRRLCLPNTDLDEQTTGEESTREILRSVMLLAGESPTLLHGDYGPATWCGRMATCRHH